MGLNMNLSAVHRRFHRFLWLLPVIGVVYISLVVAAWFHWSIESRDGVWGQLIWGKTAEDIEWKMDGWGHVVCEIELLETGKALASVKAFIHDCREINDNLLANATRCSLRGYGQRKGEVIYLLSDYEFWCETGWDPEARRMAEPIWMYRRPTPQEVNAHLDSLETDAKQQNQQVTPGRPDKPEGVRYQDFIRALARASRPRPNEARWHQKLMQSAEMPIRWFRDLPDDSYLEQ